MRKSKVEAAATRQRIVEAAASEFRRNGIGGTGLNDLMGAAGLTHGGFYKHFDSKDQAVAEACGQAIAEIGESLSAVMEKRGAKAPLHAAINAYLSVDHRDNPAAGCPFAALGPELARGSETVRQTASDGIAELAALLKERHDDPQSDDASRDALLALSAMVGAMTLARIVTDDKLSKEILKSMRLHLTGQQK
jgi:TetR/AcrR family transcriptional repressor of nem operon